YSIYTLFLHDALPILLQIEDYQNFEVADESFEIQVSEVLLQDPQQIIERSKDVLQDYKILQTQVELAETDVAIAKSARYPSIRADRKSTRLNSSHVKI